MTSSGYKRGLAFSAVSALAISGIGLASSASANTVNEQVAGFGDGGTPAASRVFLLSQGFGDADGAASVKNDGTDTTVRLEAAGGANVSSVTFGYQVGGGTAPVQTISTVQRNDDGAFSFEWDVPTALIGANIRLYATGNVANTNVDQDSRPVTINGADSSVNLTTDSQQGVFQQPYSDSSNGDVQDNKNVIFAGTASADSGDVTVDAPLTPSIGATTVTPADDDSFTGVIDITGYTFSSFGTANSNQLALRAANDTDDVESYTLYNQSIGTVTAEADDADTPAGGTTEVTVTVTDTQSQPIAGAQVIPSGGSVADAQYTDENGEATFNQAAGQTVYYYANATDADAYSAADGDKRSADVTTGQAGQPAAFTGGSDTGFNAFDVDEQGADQATVVVRDANGRRVAAGTTVNYRVVYTPFNGGTATTTTGADVTDANGEIQVPIDDASGTYQVYAAVPANANGTGAVDEALVATLKAGQSSFEFDPEGDQTAPAGSDIDYTGTLALEDGTPLTGRDVTVDYLNTGNGSDPTPDSGLADGDDADTAADDSADLTTGSDGSFDFTVTDPQNDGSELDNLLSATFADGNETSGTVEIDFATSGNLPTGTTIEVADTGTYTAGEVGYTYIQVTAPDNTVDQDPSTPGVQGDADNDRDPIEGQLVTLRTDHGYFVDTDANGEPIPSPAPVVGAPAGSYQGDATTTVTTSSSGYAYAPISIGRDQGFDDDGDVTATVTATSGGATGTGETDFTSRNPLNPGTISFQLSDDSRQEGPVDPAPVYNGSNTRVYYDAIATDQFGNRTNASFGVDVTDGDGYAYTVSQADFDDTNDADFYIGSDEAGDVDFTLTWDADTYEYTTATGDGNPSYNGTEEVTADGTATFYEFNFGDGSAAITSSPEGQVAPGTPVTETLTVLDNADQPVRGADVTFTVTAPDGTVTQFQRETNSNGEASIVVVPTQEGTYTVSAQATDGTDTLSATDTIVTTMTPEPGDPEGTLNGKSNGAKADKLTVDTVNVDPGTNVRLYVVKKGGGQKLVKAGDVGDDGTIKFKVKDQNGKKVTKYIAKVGAGNGSFFTNTERVR